MYIKGKTSSRRKEIEGMLAIIVMVSCVTCNLLEHTQDYFVKCLFARVMVSWCDFVNIDFTTFFFLSKNVKPKNPFLSNTVFLEGGGL